jgi:hypothetical protein
MELILAMLKGVDFLARPLIEESSLIFFLIPIKRALS